MNGVVAGFAMNLCLHDTSIFFRRGILREWLRQFVCRTCERVASLEFLPRDAMRKRGLCCRPVFVCPSVSLSDTFVYRNG